MRGHYINGGKAEKHKKLVENWKMGKQTENGKLIFKTAETGNHF